MEIARCPCSGHVPLEQPAPGMCRRISCDHRVTMAPIQPGTTKPQAARKPGLTWGFSVDAPWDLNPEPAARVRTSEVPKPVTEIESGRARLDRQE